MGWWPSCDEQVGKRRQHVLMLELARHDEREALPAGLADDGEDADLTPIMRAPFDKVVRPDVPGIFRPEPDAGTVIEPEPPPFRLTLRHLQPLPAPDPFDAFAVHRPTGITQQSGHPAI